MRCTDQIEDHRREAIRRRAIDKFDDLDFMALV
jgi:hypothetical protein